MKTILVAEDNTVNLELIREILALAGYAVVEAVDGASVLSRIEETEPDMVLLDIRMPHRDGFEVLRSIRGHTRFARLPVVALTAYSMRGDREKALDAGFDGYVTKPIDIAALKDEIRRFLE